MAQKKRNNFPLNNHEKFDLQQENTAVMTHQELTVRSGSLPSPEDLEHYDRISPGFAQEFMNLVKNEQNHRHLQDNKEMELSDILPPPMLTLRGGGFLGCTS